MQASSNNDSEPLIITTAEPVPNTENDAIIAQRLQIQYFRNGDSSPSSQSPAVAHAVPISDIHYGTTFPSSEEYERDPESEQILTDTLIVSRHLKIMCFADIILLFLICLVSIFWLLFIWGPIVGYIGVNKFHRRAVRIYYIYFVLRIVADALLMIFVYWWFVFVIFVDICSAYSVWTFYRMLLILSESDLAELRDPSSKIVTSTPIQLCP